MKKILALLACLISSAAFGQAQLGSGQVLGNATAARAPGQSSTVTAILDRALGSTRGAIIERGSTGWVIVGPSATVGLPWVSGGTGVDPAYVALGIAGGGTGCTSASGTCLDNITGFSATTGYLTRTGAGAYSFSFPAFSQVTGSLACSQEPARTGVVTTPAGSCANVYPSANANTMLGNWTGSAAPPIFNIIPACANDGAHALVYINGTGLVCGALTTGGTITVCGTASSGTCAMPYFTAYLSSSQTLTTTIVTKLQINTKVSDSNTWYDAVTNFRFTPQLAGRYDISGSVLCQGTSVTACYLQIYKNGASYSENVNSTVNPSVGTNILETITFNGSTDYVELWLLIDCTGTCTATGGTMPQLTAFRGKFISP